MSSVALPRPGRCSEILNLFCRCPEMFEHTWPCYGYTSVYISFREWTSLPMWASDPTVDSETERHTRTLILLKVQNKQHTYITGFG